MTAFDLSLLFFFLATFVKIMTDFVEHDKRTSTVKRAPATRSANISPNAIRTVNAFYQNPRAVRTRLTSAGAASASAANNSKKKAFRSAI